MSEREIVFWDCDEHREELTWTDRDEAIEYGIDDAAEDSPETIMVYGFARMTPSLDANDVREWLANGPFDELLDPDGDDWWTDDMQRAAEEFCARIRGAFKPWACEQVTKETVNVREWLQEHRPDWLAEYDAKHGAPEPATPTTGEES